jgi:microcystin-dependent protein
MANASVTNVFVAGTPVRASEANQNFTDVLAFMNNQIVHRDGSKSFYNIPSVDSGSPVSGQDLTTKAYVDTAVGTAIPVGIVSPFAGATAPSGWLLCQGQAVSRATYAALFAVLGVQFGAGNGSTTFNLPDLRSRFVAGRGTAAWSDVLGETGGSKDAIVVTHSHGLNSHTHGAGTLAASGGAHTHQTRGWPNRGTDSGGTTITINQSNVGLANAHMDAAGGTHTHTISGVTAPASGNTAPSGASGTDANLPPYVTLNHIIKF